MDFNGWIEYIIDMDSNIDDDVRLDDTDPLTNVDLFEKFRCHI